MGVDLAEIELTGEQEPRSPRTDDCEPLDLVSMFSYIDRTIISILQVPINDEG